MITPETDRAGTEGAPKGPEPVKAALGSLQEVCSAQFHNI